MKIEDFHALRTGTVTQPDGALVTLTVHDLGSVNVPSGRLRACDPFVNLEDAITTPIPPGSYPVKVTIADVSDAQDGSHTREAFLSVILSEGEAATISPAVSADHGAPDPGQWYGIPVDAGTVGFVDADAVASGMPSDPRTWYNDIYDSGKPDSWFNLMDADNKTPPHTANIPLPLASSGENVVLSHSGWGDGFYPLVVTHDGSGKPLAVHIDLLVVGPDDEELPPVPVEAVTTELPAPTDDPAPATKPRFFDRIFKR